MRGARSDKDKNAPGIRIIPADAGSTCPQSRQAGKRMDHPRGCGEHQTMTTAARYAVGSSPRMRGARRTVCDWSYTSGIIPADAGSTHRPKGRRSAWADHPRGCGEHLSKRSHGCSREGSSPRMRGALRTRLRATLRRRIIPADAGSTHTFSALTCIAEDHPRGCGEHIFPNQLIQFQEGSSPRMRGARQCKRHAFSHYGIIPADAGSTGLSAELIDCQEDHPRGCGEHATGLNFVGL